MSIRIIVDSTTDIIEEYVEKYNIEILPLYVVIDDKEYKDKISITTEEVYQQMRQDKLPKTSQVNIGDSYETIERICKDGDDAIYIGFSGRMSGTYQLINNIMEEMSEKYPERKLEAIDSRGGSYATGLITIQAVKMAAEGMDFDAICHRCQFLIKHVEHVFMIDDLTWMVKGGRISKTLGFISNTLNIKPILDVDDGEMEVIQKMKGKRNAMKRVADIVKERAINCQKQIIGITHADDIESAKEMVELLKERLPDCVYEITQIGAVLGVHIGIGGVGVFFFNQM